MKPNLRPSVLKLGLALVAVAKTTTAINAPSTSDYFVRNLPGLPDDANLKMHAGHINIDEKTSSNIFFWLIHNRHIADKPKFIIWLNGVIRILVLIKNQPQSMDGVFLETGPWRINSNQTLRLIDGAWNEYANPIGTGFSFASSDSYLRNVTQMYIAGESFAGTFIPYIASAILKRNSERKSSVNMRYNFKGIAIGNGWIDPITQYNAYYTFAVEHNLLDEKNKALAKDKLDICMKAQKEKVRIHLDECEQILLLILDSSRKRIGKNETCVNQYDIRDHSDSYPSCGMSWPYDLKTIYTYLRRSDVIGAIHAGAQQLGWTECSSRVGHGFDNDPSSPAVQLLPSILKQINVLLYVGDQDLICNKNGIEDMIKGLEWNGAKGFKNLTEKHWFVNNELAGHMLSERNLTYAVVHNTSHMVPYDKPGVSMAMMYRFMGIDKHIETKFQIKFDLDNTTTPASNANGTMYNGEDSEILNRYYNAGTATLIVVVCGVIALAVFVFRGRFRRRKSVSQVMKAAVESSDSEMAELVIETPLNSEDIDHFGDSDEEDNHDHDQSLLNSKTQSDQNDIEFE
ncbi:14486_t:CDS:10 [Cetraspora pellucida]|uniref:Pheromone-processing carboxypeptidase KEX1 n=1 Tax=Cetraspora pellucida TaxID=1433469 RepID=A0A9N9HGE9_9GLOM|nr:14486_t:CDS:10 [Cetraspora pellucida]